VAGRIRTCGAPRFKRPLYRAELRPPGYQHLVSGGFAAAHTRTNALAPKKGADGGNMVYPVKASEASQCSVHPASAGSTQRVTTVAGASCVTDGRSRTMFSMPLAYPSALDRRCTASYVEERWSPALLRSPEIRRQKQRLIQQRIRMRGWRRGTFLSQAGPRVLVVAFHVEHHPLVLFDLLLRRRRRPFRVALATVRMQAKR